MYLRVDWRPQIVFKMGIISCSNVLTRSSRLREKTYRPRVALHNSVDVQEGNSVWSVVVRQWSGDQDEGAVTGSHCSKLLSWAVSTWRSSGHRKEWETAARPVAPRRLSMHVLQKVWPQGRHTGSVLGCMAKSRLNVIPQFMTRRDQLSERR